MKRQVVAVALAIASFFSSNIEARQYYSPFVPTDTMHVSGASHAKNGLTWNTFSSSYLRSAHEAFMKHGTKTKQLSALYFNSDDFRLSHLFENCLVPSDTKNYNALMRIGRMKPQVEYTEQGTSVGFSVDRTFAKGKGRLGLRARTEFKKRQVERKDAESFGVRDVTRTVTRDYIDSATTNATESDPLDLYRLDLLGALPSSTRNTTQITHDGGNRVQVNGQVATTDAAEVNASVAYSPEGKVPMGSHIGSTEVRYGGTGTEIAGEVPVTLDGLSEDKAYQFKAATKYTAFDESALATVAERVAVQDKKATLWVSQTIQSSGVNEGEKQNSTIMTPIDSSSTNREQFLEDVHTWLAAQEYRFATDKHVGLGDTTIELFYQHSLSDTFGLELSGGVIAPTAAGKKQHSNPYNVHLGNNGHTEVIAGLGFDWQPCRWFGLTVHGDYGKALKSREQRMAVAAGSLVRNIGPRADCDVEWQWARAQADFCFVHPKMRGLSTTIGYRFLYKEREKVTFDDETMDSWLGAKYNATTAKFSGANTFTLDDTLASANSEAMAHTVCVSCRYDVNEYFSLKCGGSYAIAGQNMPQETEIHLGCVVKL